MGKKLSVFNGITTPNDTYKISLFTANVDNYYCNPSDLFKTNSLWKGVSNSVIAFAGGGQASATSLTTEVSFVGTCATRDDSVKLPTALAGKHYVVINLGAQACNVYTQTGENFLGQSANTPVSVATLSYTEFTCNTDGVYVFRHIIGSYLSDTTITAFAGGGQANATQLNKEYNKVTVVATTGDSVKLKAAKRGVRQIIVNADTAEAMDVFPQSGDNYEGLAVNLAVSLTFGASMEAFCFVDNEWTLL